MSAGVAVPLPSWTIHQGDALAVLRTMPAESVHCCVTSPPYFGLRDYSIVPQAWGGDVDHKHRWGAEILVNATNHRDKRRWNHAQNGRGEEQPEAKRPDWKRQKIGQGNFCRCGAWRGSLGLEPTPELYLEHIVEVFREVWRVLRGDGTLWLNMGDSYANDGKWGGATGGKHVVELHGQPIGRAKRHTGLKAKDLIGAPWMVAFALRNAGWYLRSDIIWDKPNVMPESVKDRPTKAHEYLFLLSKSERYYYDYAAIMQPASPDTHARYARGRSDKHKWADGGPGNQTIATNRPGSLFVRIGREGRNSRMHQDRDPSHSSERKIKKIPAGWHQGSRAAGSAPRDRRAPGVNPKCAEPGSGIKQNTSFSHAVKDIVSSRNCRTVWRINSAPFKGAHFATFPPKLVEPCILAGCPVGGVVLDPFAGAGTTLLVAQQRGRNSVGIELNPEYVAMAEARLRLGQRTVAPASIATARPPARSRPRSTTEVYHE